ncbi:transcriptional regulator [Loktanella sp. IMCC34160]|uniref:ArsR/SmtB family transcription factor n=1 Tax=Loktanella sp. IMCC34160 TaxID=2510646 RepID=UPI00101DA32D|nr:metalloregulator ArsR/SmtB family transcription factor [Loktanella sp. IMCC34160]RYG92545.1 transcriptional regulator [Loktanella sp. IMCC34160]
MAKYGANLDLCFAALSDPTRRAILSRLARGEATVSELAAPHDMALPSFMGHLRRLEEAGLVATRKSGRTRFCTLSANAFLPARSWLDEQKDLWEQRLDTLDTYVTSLLKDDPDEP